MTGTELEVDAKGTDCRCCGDALESKDSGRLCGACIGAGCDPSTTVCMKDIGGA